MHPKLSRWSQVYFTTHAKRCLTTATLMVSCHKACQPKNLEKNKGVAPFLQVNLSSGGLIFCWRIMRQSHGNTHRSRGRSDRRSPPHSGPGPPETCRARTAAGNRTPWRCRSPAARQRARQPALSSCGKPFFSGQPALFGGFKGKQVLLFGSSRGFKGKPKGKQTFWGVPEKKKVTCLRQVGGGCCWLPGFQTDLTKPTTPSPKLNRTTNTT